jgi:hypothetical protein
MSHCIATLTAATVALFALGQAALADLMINIDKSTQRMTVTVDGKQIYNWPVSTGGLGYDTPSGTFKPFRMEIDHYSDEYDNAIGEKRRDAVGIGEGREDGQRHCSFERHDLRWRIIGCGTLPSIAAERR